MKATLLKSPRAPLVFLSCLIVTGPAWANTVATHCTLRNAKPVTASRDGQVIEQLRIRADSRPAVTVTGFRNVTIRNVWIEHRNASGILFSKAPNLTIENVRIVNVSPSANGNGGRTGRSKTTSPARSRRMSPSTG